MSGRISYNYAWPEDFEARMRELEQYHRPIICTEYMARGVGSLFNTILPFAKRYHVGAINCGFVAGKTQPYLPWDSWERPYVLEQAPVWFHDVFHPDGTPYRQREAEITRGLRVQKLLRERRIWFLCDWECQRQVWSSLRRVHRTNVKQPCA